MKSTAVISSTVQSYAHYNDLRQDASYSSFLSITANTPVTANVNINDWVYTNSLWVQITITWSSITWINFPTWAWNKWYVLLSLNDSWVVVKTYWTTSPTPTKPWTPADNLPLAYLLLSQGWTTIAQTDIIDARNIWFSMLSWLTKSSIINDLYKYEIEAIINNRIVNNWFETDLSWYVVYWSATITRDISQYHSGSASMKIVTWASWNSWAFTSLTYPINVWTKGTFSFYVKWTLGDTFRCYTAFWWADTYVEAVMTWSWQRMENSFTTLTGNPFLYMMSTMNNKTFYIDDVQFDEWTLTAQTFSSSIWNVTINLLNYLKQTPSVSVPIKVQIWDTVRTVTSALSVTKNSWTNWFGSWSSLLATKEWNYFVYLGYNITDWVTIWFSKLSLATVYFDFSTTSTNNRYAWISTITNATAIDKYQNIWKVSLILGVSATYNWSLWTWPVCSQYMNDLSIYSKMTQVVVWDTNADYITDWTDDNIQIQQAIDYINSIWWGTIYIKPWIYYITTWLILKPNVTIIWDKWAVELKGATGVWWGIIYQGSWYPVTNCTIKNIIINANNIYNVSWIQIYLFDWLILEWITIKNVNGVWGIMVWTYTDWASFNFIMDSCILDYIHDTTLEWFLITNTENFELKDNTFKNCDLINASTISIFLWNSNWTLTNNYFENSVDDFCLVDMTWSQDIIFSNNHLKHKWTNWWSWVIIRNCKNINIDTNDFKSNNNGWYWVHLLDWNSTIDWHTNPFPNSENIKVDNNIIDWFYYSCLVQSNDSWASTNNWRNDLSFQNNTCSNYNYAWFCISYLTRDVYSNNISWNTFIPKSSWAHKWILIVWNSPYKLNKSNINNNIVRCISGNSDCIDLTYCDTINVHWNMLTPNWTGVAIKQTNCTAIDIWVQTDITGNAWTATALQTARTINWVSFDWTANITTGVINTKTTKSSNTVYQASWNWGVLVFVKTGASYEGVIIYSDWTATPTTIVWQQGASNAEYTVATPIMPNMYYKATTLVGTYIMNYYENV